MKTARQLLREAKLEESERTFLLLGRFVGLDKVVADTPLYDEIDIERLKKFTRYYVGVFDV